MILRVWAAREKVLVLMWVGVFGFEAGLGLLVLVQQYLGRKHDFFPSQFFLGLLYDLGFLFAPCQWRAEFYSS